MWLTILTVVIFTALGSSTDPGVKVRVTKKGIDYANKVAHDEIVKHLQTLQIPDQSGSEGHISYSLTSIHVESVTPPASVISLVPGKNGISWALSNFGIAIRADWRVKYKRKWVHISDSGSVDASVSGVNVQETAAFGTDATGRPSIASSGCTQSIGGVSVRFHGGTSFILNLFRHTVEHRVRDMLQSRICNEVVNVINNDAEKNLANMDVTVQIANSFLLDYRLVSAPVVTADFVEVWDKGEVFWAADTKESPFVPQPIPAWTQNDRMVYIWATAYSPNTFLYQAHSHEFLQYNVTKKDLPPDQASFLNTTCTFKCIGTIIPQIGAQYPHSTVELRIKTATVPKTSVTSQAFTAGGAALVEMWAHTPDQKVAYLLTLNMSLSLQLNASIQNEKLSAAITGHSFKLAVVKSAVGTLSPTLLNIVLGGVLDFAVIPKINKIIQRGIALPIVGGVTFMNTMLVLQEGNILIGTDLQFKVDHTLRFEAAPQYRVIGAA